MSEDLKMVAVMTKTGQQINIKTRMPLAEILKEYHGTDLSRPWCDFIGLNERNETVTVVIERDIVAGMIVGPMPSQSQIAVPTGPRILP